MSFRSPLFILGLSAPVITKTATLPIFDVRIMASAISVSGGSAIDQTDLGAISYAFNDMKKNSGDLTLPYG